MPIVNTEKHLKTEERLAKSDRTDADDVIA